MGQTAYRQRSVQVLFDETEYRLKTVFSNCSWVTTRGDDAIHHAAEGFDQSACANIRLAEFTLQLPYRCKRVLGNTEKARPGFREIPAKLLANNMSQTEKIPPGSEVDQQPEQLSALHGLIAGAVGFARKSKESLPAPHPVGRLTQGKVL